MSSLLNWKQVEKFTPRWMDHLPNSFTKRKILLVGGSVTGLLMIVTLVYAIFPAAHANDETRNQLEELMKTNQELQNTITTLRSKTQNRNGGAVTRIARASTSFVETEPGEGFRAVKLDSKEIYIPKGAVFKARLITSIKTSLQESFVIAETTYPFAMDFKRRIEKGSRLIGSATLDRALQGVVVKFDTLVTPQGHEHDDLSLIALSENAYPLIEGIYFSNAGVKYGTALAFGFLSGFASGGMQREATIAGSVATPSLSNQALSGVSVASFKVAEQAMDSLKDEGVEQIIVPAGTDIYLAFTKKWNLPQTEGALR